MTTNLYFFATCPKNFEGLLEEELREFSAANRGLKVLNNGTKQNKSRQASINPSCEGSIIKQTVGGVYFTGDLEIAYRACLWSRTANRILLVLTSFTVNSAEALYSGVRSINWLAHIRPTDTIAVDFVGLSAVIENSHFGALKVKDAIVDQIRERTGDRPSIKKNQPTLRINAYLKKDMVTISIDLSGDSLHRRAYRNLSGIAPVKENLAAAVLYRANWPKIAATGVPFLDPMCGSGTILIEAAQMAADIAPGLLRDNFGFSYWLKHDRYLWGQLWNEAQARREAGLQGLQSKIYGYDIDPECVAAAKNNIKHAGLGQYIFVKQQSLRDCVPPEAETRAGLIVTNPPYGIRISEADDAGDVYSTLGEVLRTKFDKWQAAVLTGTPELGKTMGIKAIKQYNFFNGALPCKLLMFEVHKQWFVKAYHSDTISAQSKIIGCNSYAPGVIPASAGIQKNPNQTEN